MATTARLSLDDEFARYCNTSLRLSREASELFPGGVTHDVRHLEPFALYVDRAQGSRKWDADGHELIDYWMGHGALLLGHNHPAVQAAVAEQVQRGTHYGASHRLEIEWARQVIRLVPSVDVVRFTSSGTEATMMAMRLSRAFTGRTRILKFRGHFHGWHDYAAPGYMPPFDLPADLPGIPAATQSTLAVCRPNDLAGVRATLASGDVAAVIIEPSGALAGTVPTDPDFLRGLRQATQEAGALLIFDEVVSGFRYAPGGAQEYFEVLPDLTTMAKILAGGLPGGAVGGRRDLMEQLTVGHKRKIAHAGTFNANPISAAAGGAALELVATGEPNRRANATADTLRRELAAIVTRRGIPGLVYGDVSLVHWYLGEEAPSLTDVASPAYQEGAEHLLMRGGKSRMALRKALILNGVDCAGGQLTVSAVHDDRDVEQTLRAFDQAFERLQLDGVL